MEQLDGTRLCRRLVGLTPGDAGAGCDDVYKESRAIAARRYVHLLHENTVASYRRHLLGVGQTFLRRWHAD